MFAIRLANEVSRHHDVTFLELNPFHSEAKHQLRLLDTQGITLIQAGNNAVGRWLYKGRSLRFLKRRVRRIYDRLKRARIRYLLARRRIDIVHSHCWDTDLYFSMLKMAAGFKLISSFHGHYELLKNQREGFETKTTLMLGQIDKVVYVSPAHGETLDKYQFDPQRRHKIFYGVPYPKQESCTRFGAEQLQLTLVARGIPEKGWKETVEAVCSLEEKWPGRVRLHLVGDGEFLRSLQHSKHAESVVVFHGYQEDVRSAIVQSHVCLLPSYYPAESLPNSVIEYVLCGKPVIATRIGAIPEMISYGGEVGGTLIDLVNGTVRPGDIEAAILRYLEEPTLVERHSRVALLASSQFLMTTCVSAHCQLYSDTVEQARAEVSA